MSLNTKLDALNRFVDWFIPAAIAHDREARKQARMFLYSHIFGPFIGNSVPLALYFFSPRPGSDIAVLAVSITSFWIFPFILRAGVRYNLLAVLSVEILIFSILWSCYFHGGVTSPTLPWMLTIPLLAFFYIGSSPTMRTIVLTQFAINLLIFFCLYYGKHPDDGGMSQGATQILGLVSTIAASLYVTMMAMVYANALASQVELENEMREHLITAAALRQATNEAQRASAAKSDFVANMSHELRTPLNAVIGYSEILIEESIEENDTSNISDLQEIHGAGRYLLKLVNDILDMSKIDAGKMDVYNEFADCAQLLQKATELHLQAAQKASVKFLIETDANCGTIYTDVMKLQQAIGHLINNAIRYSHGGTVTLECFRIPGDRGDQIVINVRDTGSGIAPEVLSTLFEQFNSAGDTSSTKYGGTGLGLALSKRLCNLLQGVLSVRSELGAGSCFTICLPATAKAREAEDESDQDAIAEVLRTAEEYSKRLHVVVDAAAAGAVSNTSKPLKERAANV